MWMGHAEWSSTLGKPGVVPIAAAPPKSGPPAGVAQARAGVQAIGTTPGFPNVLDPLIEGGDSEVFIREDIDVDGAGPPAGVAQARAGVQVAPRRQRRLEKAPAGSEPDLGLSSASGSDPAGAFSSLRCRLGATCTPARA
jgi:hypothetical protein